MKSWNPVKLQFYQHYNFAIKQCTYIPWWSDKVFKSATLGDKPWPWEACAVMERPLERHRPGHEANKRDKWITAHWGQQQNLYTKNWSTINAASRNPNRNWFRRIYCQREHFRHKLHLQTRECSPVWRRASRHWWEQKLSPHKSNQKTLKSHLRNRQWFCIQ